MMMMKNGVNGMKNLIERMGEARALAQKSGYKQLNEMLTEMYFYTSGLYNGLTFHEDSDCGCHGEEE